MKTLLISLALLPLFAKASLPIEGQYVCGADRAFNMPATTYDQMKLQYWTSQAGQPTVKITTKNGEAVKPSFFGGSLSQLSTPAEPSRCIGVVRSYQMKDCVEALLYTQKDSGNLFEAVGDQRVVSAKISSNYDTVMYVAPNKTEKATGLSVAIEFRKGESHWTRLYACLLKK